MLDAAKILISVDVGNLILMCDEAGLTIEDRRRLTERLQRLNEMGAVEQVVSVKFEAEREEKSGA